MFLNSFYDRDENKIWIWDDKKGLLSFKHKPYAYIKSKTGQTEIFSVFGEPVKRVFRWTSADEENGNVFESDVPVLTRTLIDAYSTTDDIPVGHKVAILDIEVSSVTGFPDVITAESEILSIAIYDKLCKKYTIFVLDKMRLYKTIVDDNIETLFFETEEELLQSFLLKWMDIKPTIISGWNISGFDLPYLYHRIKRILGADIAVMLSPIGKIIWEEYKEQYKIAGISVLDYLGLYKKFTYTQESSYNLDAIGKKEVNLGKLKFEGSLDNLFKTDIKKFIEYNLTDVKIVTKIDEKMELIDLVISICHKAHVPYEDVYYSSRVIDGAILTYLKRLNIVAPNKKFTSNEAAAADGFESYSGAYVKEPIPGRYFWIYDLDMTSLYPSVIMSLNISLETKIAKVNNWDAEQYIRGTAITYNVDILNKQSKKMTSDELKDWLDVHQYSIASNGVVYNLKNKGIIPAILESWFNDRLEYRKLMKKYGDEGDTAKYEHFKHLQHVTKILLNSVYGCLGAAASRYYDKDNAEATTMTGVQIIKFTEKLINKYYNDRTGKKYKLTYDDGTVEYKYGKEEIDGILVENLFKKS